MSQVKAAMHYVGRTPDRPRYYANDHSRDTVVIAAEEVTILDGREHPPQLETHGFELLKHHTEISDFSDPFAPGERYRNEIASVLRERVGADHIVVTGHGVLRYSERSDLAGTLNNSLPARFAHIDISDHSAAQFAERAAPDRAYARVAAFNLWRVFTPPPQDVPLAICDARTVTNDELILSDAIFDEPSAPAWSFESLTVAANPHHQWYWFSDMRLDELILFVTHDSDPTRPHCVPHCAFDHPSTQSHWLARGSIEMRATCYWY